jgi:hypothetical protein
MVMWSHEWIRCGLGLVAFGVLSGCTAEADIEDDDTLGAKSSLVKQNALSKNAMSWNGISLNGISLNGISLNALDADTLAPGDYNAITAPTAAGDLARQFMRYAVSCAFSPSQTFSFDWTDAAGAAHHEAYPGELAVAPSWATGPIYDQDQRMLTGCLAARVNFYEVPVTISVRSVIEPLKTLSSMPELIDYPDVEGAFWGNMFAPQPYINACYNSGTVDNSRAYQRECATGHLVSGTTYVECGPIRIVGPCSSVCMSLNGGGFYYPACRDKPGISGSLTKAVVTTALP